MDANYLYKALTRWNYFPNQKSNSEELPPVFSTRQFTPAVAKRLAEEKMRKDGYDQVEYYSTRYNNVSRPLSLPHPVGYAHLVKCICDNWDTLRYVNANPVSLIKPETHPYGRAVVMDYEESLEKNSRALNAGFGKKFRVHTDIANCFPSIYTHAIPWALVGVAEAKDKSPHKNSEFKKLWFNQLDYCQRMIKRNETQGIAIGPATSNVVTEAILARIDEVLSKTFSYYRYIDDYTCYCDTYEAGEEFLRQLNAKLREYKLSLNLKKTEIVELPAPLDSEWIVELSTRMPVGTPNKPPQQGRQYSASEALRYIDFAVQLRKKSPDGSVLKFAIKSVIYNLDENSVQPVLEYLLSLSRFYPLLLPLLGSLFAHPAIQTNIYEENLNAILKDNATNRRSDGMCWALYYLHYHKLKVSQECVREIIETRDCMAILMLHVAGGCKSEIAAFVCSLNQSDPYELDQYWVLLYQLFYDGENGNPYSKEKCFDILKEEDVSFVPKKDHFSKSEHALAVEDFAGLEPEVGKS